MANRAKSKLEKRVDQQYWGGLTEALNFLHSELQRKPRHIRSPYQLSPGGILNAYREGDISFKRAVKDLESWKKRG
jgi:hypothetical protein